MGLVIFLRQALGSAQHFRLFQPTSGAICISELLRRTGSGHSTNIWVYLFMVCAKNYSLAFLLCVTLLDIDPWQSAPGRGSLKVRGSPRTKANLSVALQLSSSPQIQQRWAPDLHQRTPWRGPWSSSSSSRPSSSSKSMTVPPASRQDRSPPWDPESLLQVLGSLSPRRAAGSQHQRTSWI